MDDQLNWKQHVTNTIRSASSKIYMLGRLKSLGTPADELKGVYTSFILPKLMYASPAWSSPLNLTQHHQLEKVKKRALRIILGPAYCDYKGALITLNLQRLSVRHWEALMKFGEGLLKHPRHRKLLPPDAPPRIRATRHRNMLIPLKAPRTDRFKNNAIPSIVRSLNSM